MKLIRALRAGPADRTAFVGAGGKTSAVFTLAREYAEQGQAPIITTTTHLAEDQVRMGDRHFTADIARDLEQLDMQSPGILVVTASGSADGRVHGPTRPVLDRLAEISRVNGRPLLIEADGARRLPLKAPAAHEPAVPAFADSVVVSAGLSGLGAPLDGEHVHRPAQFGELAGLAAGAPVRADALARVLVHPQGGRKGIPAGARRIALLNQADTAVLQAQAGSIARALAGDFDAVLVASIASGIVHAVREPVAAVVLAAGGSKRLGSPKQLLDWGGVPLAAHAAGIAQAAGCDPVVVVTGAARAQVRAAVQDLGVMEVFNPDWEAGQSTSVQAGVAALSGERPVGAALFLLVDQPFVEPALLRLLIDTHARSLAPIVAPLIDQQRGNPVLFDRDTFPAFAALAGDAGGRQLFSRFKADWVPWHNALALRDIDTWEDYYELRP